MSCHHTFLVWSESGYLLHYHKKVMSRQLWDRYNSDTYWSLWGNCLFACSILPSMRHIRTGESSLAGHSTGSASVQHPWSWGLRVSLKGLIMVSVSRSQNPNWWPSNHGYKSYGTEPPLAFIHHSRFSVGPKISTVCECLFQTMWKITEIIN